MQLSAFSVRARMLYGARRTPVSRIPGWRCPRREHVICGPAGEIILPRPPMFCFRSAQTSAATRGARMPDLEIMWTKVDEAPALATYSLLPIVQAFVGAAGVSVKLKDISLAGRILAPAAFRSAGGYLAPAYKQGFYQRSAGAIGRAPNSRQSNSRLAMSAPRTIHLRARGRNHSTAPANVQFPLGPNRHGDQRCKHARSRNHVDEGR